MKILFEIFKYTILYIFIIYVPIYLLYIFGLCKLRKEGLNKVKNTLFFTIFTVILIILGVLNEML